MEQAPLFDFPGKGNDLLKGEANEMNKKATVSPLKIVHPEPIELVSPQVLTPEEELVKVKLEMERTCEAMSSLNKDLTDSINYAKQIQEAILPDQKILFDFTKESFILYKPKSIVSGDFYWFTRYDDKILIAMVDCTGHGVPGAFMSMIGHNLLNEIVNVKDIVQPAEILNRLDRSVRLLLKQDTSKPGTTDGMDVAMCSFDPAKNTLEFAGANRPLFLMQSGELREIKGDKVSIGGTMHSAENRFTNHEIKLNKGDKFYVLSDGFVDQFGGPKNKKLLKRRFKRLLKLVEPLNLRQQEKVIMRFFNEWKGGHEQTDDVLMIGLGL